MIAALNFVASHLLAAQLSVQPTPVAPVAPVDAAMQQDAAPVEPTAAPADAVDPSAQQALAFGDHLFSDGDWYRAITEYRRYLYVVKGRSNEAPRVAMAIGEALLRGEQYDAAGRQLDGVAQRAATTDLRRDALFAAGRAYLLDSRPELAKPRFRLLVEDKEADDKLKAHATWLLAWGHFDAGELTEARAYFQRLSQQRSGFEKDAAGILDRIDHKDDVALKDPLLAAVLSGIPGLGHVYLGQYAVGATSFVWNAIFIAAIVHAIIVGDYGVAVLLSFAELGWYSGGIFGAVAGAYRHNRDAVRNWRDDVLASYGQRRELPEMKDVQQAPPGTMLRFSGGF